MWLENGTIKNAILFGKKKEKGEVAWPSTIKAAQLAQDFEEMAEGDLRKIYCNGNYGVSGG